MTRLEGILSQLPGPHVGNRNGEGPVVEHTATLIWKVLSQIRALVVLWNVFPLHPLCRWQSLDWLEQGVMNGLRPA